MNIIPVLRLELADHHWHSLSSLRQVIARADRTILLGLQALVKSGEVEMSGTYAKRLWRLK